MTTPNLYEHGLDRIDTDRGPVRGFAVIEGSEGETPEIVAFVKGEDLAQALVRATYTMGYSAGEAVIGDASYSLAVMTDRGIYASNDSDIDTHEALELAVTRFEVAERLRERTELIARSVERKK